MKINYEETSRGSYHSASYFYNRNPRDHIFDEKPAINIWRIFSFLRYFRATEPLIAIAFRGLPLTKNLDNRRIRVKLC